MICNDSNDTISYKLNDTMLYINNSNIVCDEINDWITNNNWSNATVIDIINELNGVSICNCNSNDTYCIIFVSLIDINHDNDSSITLFEWRDYYINQWMLFELHDAIIRYDSKCFT